MNRFTWDEFLERASDFDETVARTPEIATFCSSLLWQRTAMEHFFVPGDGDDLFIVEEEGIWIVFAERENRRIYYPLEACWMFGCPLVGDPAGAFDLLRRAKDQYLIGPAGFCFGGIRIGGALQEQIRHRRDSFLQYEEFPGTDCMEIDLRDGFEGWWERRSRRFRKNMDRLSLPGGASIEDRGSEDPDTVMKLILDIQQRIYKSGEGNDIFAEPSYRAFYESLLRELHGRGALRLLVLQRDGEAFAYIFGGVAGEIYRGFQMSYVEEAREWGAGNLLQLANLRARAEEGVQRYDLGMHSSYKERWADRWDRYAGVFFVL